MVSLSRPVRADGVEAHAPQPSLHVAEPPIAVLRLEPPPAQRRALRQGLCQEPARLSPKHFYDPQGCALYEAICLLDEYELPRLEAELFDRHEAEIARALPPGPAFVDLGCGDGGKAQRWIERLQARHYLGVDIAHDALRDTLRRGAKRHPGTVFEGVVTDFTLGLSLHEHLDARLPRVFFYPGSSIGNFEPEDAVRLLREVGQHLRDTDRLVIGADAPKPLARMLAAYDDALGVTAAFNLNILRVVNAQIGSDFRPQDFLHRAYFDPEASRVEMHLVARHDVTVQVGDGRQRVFRAGEAIVTEHSYKHSPERMQQLLAEAGYGEVRSFVHADGYGVYVAAPGGRVQ